MITGNMYSDNIMMLLVMGYERIITMMMIMGSQTMMMMLLVMVMGYERMMAIDLGLHLQVLTI